MIRRRAVGDRTQHVGELPAQTHMAGVFLPGDHRHVPIQVLHREAVVDAVVRALGAGEETLDPVGVGTVLGLVGVGCFSLRTPTLWNLLPEPAKSRTHPLALPSQRHQANTNPHI